MDHKERPYHHGDLRRVLLEAALQLTEERGIHGFTLREVARQAGVSHNAPYHHFADKAALVAAVTAEGFERLEGELRTVYDRTEGTSLDKVLGTGVAYVHFALAHPAIFRLMFRPELRLGAGSDPKRDEIQVDQAGERAFAVLLNGIRTAQASGFIADGDSIQLAIAAWSTVHGLAILLLDSSLEHIYRGTEDTEKMIEHIVHILSRGLLVRPGA